MEVLFFQMEILFFRRHFVYGAKIGAIFELGASNEIEVGFKAEQIEYNTRNYYQEAIGSNFYDPRQTNYGLYLGYTYKF